MTDPNTPKNFSVDRFQSFADVFVYNDTYQFGTKTLLESGNRKLTYGQVENLSKCICTLFADKGIKQGDRVIILSHDDICVFLLFMGCLRYGATAVILNPESSKDELENLMKAAKPSLLALDKDYFGKIRTPEKCAKINIAPGNDHASPSFISKLMGKADSGEFFPGMLHKIDPIEENPRVSHDTVAYILFTSGTTSRPKGVEITHSNLLNQMKTFVRHYGYTVRSELLNVLPLHHTDGLTQGPVVAFTAGCSVYRPMKFSIDKLPDLMNAVYKHKITHFIAVPAMLQLIDKLGENFVQTFKNEHFKFIISTAGYLDPNLWERFEERFGVMVVNVYGLTETVCEALYCGPTEETRKIGTIGKPVDTECVIADDEGNEVAPGETGELWLKGKHIMKGYFEMPEETAEVMTGEGWFKTGDLCRVDEDGFYQIVGRKKNVIIVGGMNIYPDDVANILRSIPGVTDAAVWGEPDDTWGETVNAAIIPDKGATISTDDISEEFVKRAAVEMVPRQIHVVEDFPRGPAGKVIIRDLQDAITDTGGSKEGHEEGGSLADNVIAVASRSFKCPEEELSLESTMETTKGWNSLAHVEFILALEKEFGIKVAPKDILAVRSIGDALKIVETKKNKAA